MKASSTIVRTIHPHTPEQETLANAAQRLRNGQLVAFPTETVYGLGANALNADAVAAIYAAKGRPAANPIIVHVADVEAAKQLTRFWPHEADLLAEHFWPGPLTIVLPRSSQVPDIVTAGGPTVGIRVPGHPVALGLLQTAQIPLAAPSANASGEISPTCAEHVLRSLNGKIDLILDAGPTQVGLESTVVDLTTKPIRILRPGQITKADLERVIGGSVEAASSPATELRSPGMLPRHYAPRTAAECVPSETFEKRLNQLLNDGRRVGCLIIESSDAAARCQLVKSLPNRPADYAAGLYAALHELDRFHLDRILIEMPPAGDAWAAIHDRLRRATA